MTRLFCLLSTLSLVAACTIGAKPEGTPVKPDSVTGILLRIPPENLAAGEAAHPEELAVRIAKNLAGWGYPISADQAVAHSHVMVVEVSGVEKKSTPPGFSFTAGDSDPRALNFQKADVVTVTCRVRSVARRSENAYLKEEFVAESILKQKEFPAGDPALFQVYVDHIGTACFNLLSELHVRRSQPAPVSSADVLPEAAGSSPSWFPEVSVEIREKPAAPKPAAATPAVAPVEPVEPSTPSRVPAAAEPAHAPSGTSAPEASPVPAPNTPRSAGESSGQPAPKSETPQVRTETQQGEGRKQIIIHNRGNPIMLEFGYERR